MVIVDIEKPEKNFRSLVENQIVKDIMYVICDNHAPTLDAVYKRIEIAYIDNQKINDYKTIHGIDFSDMGLRSYCLYEDKKGSSHGGEYLDDEMGYYQEVIEAFENLINSGNSEFTFKALKALDEVKDYAVMVGSGKNAI